MCAADVGRQCRGRPIPELRSPTRSLCASPLAQGPVCLLFLRQLTQPEQLIQPPNEHGQHPGRKRPSATTHRWYTVFLWHRFYTVFLWHRFYTVFLWHRFYTVFTRFFVASVLNGFYTGQCQVPGDAASIRWPRMLAANVGQAHSRAALACYRRDARMGLPLHWQHWRSINFRAANDT